MSDTREPVILSIGGGKGGVGKSMVSSNLSVQYAQAGLRVILIDLDFGAANIHTIFGHRNPSVGLGDYFTTPRSQLTDYLMESGLKGLQLIPGSGFVPELANLKHTQKHKLFRHLKTLNADLVVLDLGAGSANNVVDFFSMSTASVVVSTPEPTSVVNAYEFLKNVVYRILYRAFRKHEEIAQIVKDSINPHNTDQIHTVADILHKVEKRWPWMAEALLDLCHNLDFTIVFNMARKSSQAQLGTKLRKICEKHLCLKLNYAGIVYFNEEVPNSVFQMSPVSLHSPESITAKTLKRIANQILQDVAQHEVQGISDPFEKQLQRVEKDAKKDYVENLLTQKRLARECTF